MWHSHDFLLPCIFKEESIYYELYAHMETLFDILRKLNEYEYTLPPFFSCLSVTTLWQFLYFTRVYRQSTWSPSFANKPNKWSFQVNQLLTKIKMHCMCAIPVLISYLHKQSVVVIKFRKLTQNIQIAFTFTLSFKFAL